MHIPLFLAYFNRQHPNIIFTCEVESNCQFSFLDITIKRTNGHFETSVYRKPTFTGLFTNFHSFTPPQFKRGLMYSLLHRFFNICSKYENFHAQIEFFRKFLLNQNDYPTRLFDRCVRLFLDKTFQPKELIHSVSKKVVYSIFFHIPEHTLSKSVPKFNAFLHISIRMCFVPLYVCPISSCLKSSREPVWPEWLRWEKMLASWGLLLVVPVKAEILRYSETRVYVDGGPFGPHRTRKSIDT
jgi:hypothetical protein